MELLPPIRTDLTLEPYTTTADGQTIYTLVDSLNVQYYRLTQSTYIIINYWDTITPEALLERIHAAHYYQISEQDIQMTLHFLTNNQLIQSHDAEQINMLLQQKKNAQIGWIKWLIHHYLFIKIPLVKPDRFLRRTLPYVKFLFSKPYWIFICFLAIFSIYLTMQQWNQFIHPLDNLFNLDGVLLLFLSMSIIKIIHELGHAYVNTYFGCKVHSMGVAFLVLFPLLYTDASDAWKIPDSRKRMIIDCSGVLAELQAMIWMLFLWHFTDSTLIKSLITYAITVSLVFTFVINLSPLMRFDGYYAFANALDIDNLQPRSFALARWQLRRWLIGIQDPAPIKVSSRKKRLMIIYAYITWIYRFFLFLGIAAVVYFLFFKVLGIILFLVEIIYFIVKPILGEIWFMLKNLNKVRINKHTLFTSLSILSVLLLLIIPWRTHLVLPAELVIAQKANFYTDTPCLASALPYANQTLVTQNKELFICESPDLIAQEKILILKIRAAEKKIRQQQGMGQKLGSKQLSQSDIDALKGQLKNLQKQKNKLILTSTFTGYVVNRTPNIGPSRWYAESTFLMSVITLSQWQVIAYVSENDLNRISKSIHNGFFLSNLPDEPSLHLKLSSQSIARASQLDNPYLSNTYGGPLTVNASGSAQSHLTLNQSVFPITFEVINPTSIFYEQRGVVVIEGRAQSIIKRFYLHVLALFVRESSF